MTIPTKTLAVRLFEYGGPEKLVIGEYDLPPLGERDVLVKNHAGSVSRWDVKYRAGDLARYQLPGRAPFPLPQQLGREAAGEVVAVARAATRFKPGDRVIGVTHPEDPDSVETARGLGNLSRNLAIPGPSGVRLLRAISRSRRAHVAAAAGRRRFRAGRRRAVAILVVAPRGARPSAGAAGRQRADRRRVRRHGSGDDATRKARRRARDRHDAARGQGRRSCASLAPTRWSSPPTRSKRPKEVSKLTGGEGVDHAVDYTGNPELLRFIKGVMRLGGTVVITSEQGRESLPFTAADLIRLELNLLGIRGARMNDMLTVLKLLGESRIKTRIAARFPLAKVGEAHTLLETSPDLVGRIVVLPWA